LLIAAIGEELAYEEREIFRKLTGRERESGQRVEELVCVVGRRGGKSRAMATLACYVAGLCEHDLMSAILHRLPCFCGTMEVGHFGGSLPGNDVQTRLPTGRNKRYARGGM